MHVSAIRNTFRAVLLATLLLLGGAVVPGVAPAQAGQAGPDWPTRPIRIIVPGSAGASGDQLARLLAPYLQERLGVAIVVENKNGAGGILGADFVAKAAPDGYTVMVAYQDSQVLTPLLNKNVPYDPLRDFTSIAKLGDIPLIFVVPPSSPARSIGEFLALARQQPGKLNLGTGGTGGINHLAGELLKQRTGINIVHVPYKGGAAATTAILAGEVNLFAGSYSLAGAAIRAGRLRGLATTRSTRLPLLPDVPTMAEAGIPDFVVTAWFGLFGPRALPAPIANRLSDVALEIAREPGFRQRVEGAGSEVAPLGIDQFGKFVQDELTRWRAVITRANISIDE